MFVSVWLIFLTSGLLIAIGTLLWSIKTRQFDDQQRAAYIPLLGLSAEELSSRPPVKRGVTFYTWIAIMLMGASSIGVTLYFVMS